MSINLTLLCLALLVKDGQDDQERVERDTVRAHHLHGNQSRRDREQRRAIPTSHCQPNHLRHVVKHQQFQYVHYKQCV